MSMTAQFITVTPTELAALLANPDTAPSAFVERLESADDERVLDIEQSWNGIHFLLTGTSLEGEPPYSDVILGREEFGPDFVYGPVRFLAPADVATVASVLGSLAIESLRERYIPDDMEALDIYPSGIWHDEPDETFAWLAENLEALRTFYRRAAERGDGVLLGLT